MGNGWYRAGLAMLSLLIAALSYHFFETPIRRQHKLVAQPRMAVVAAVALMILAGVLALRWQHAAAIRMRSSEQRPYQLARVDLPVIYGMGCDDWYHSAAVQICGFGEKNAKHTAVALGDSAGLQWFPAYAQVFDRPDWRLLVLTKSACPMVDVPIFYSRIGREYTECAQWRRDVLQGVTALKPDVVVLGSVFTYDYTQEQWEQGSRRVLQVLSANAGRVYLMRSTPVLPFNGPSCLDPRSAFYNTLTKSSHCASSARSERGDDVFAWLKTAAASFPNVQLVDMTPNVCPQDICRAELDGKIVFRDTQHLTASFAKSLAPALEQAFQLNGSPVALPTAAARSVTAPN